MIDLDNLTNGEKSFIWNVENNRGEIKNKEKFYPILVDTYEEAITEFREHLTHSKHLGIQLVHKIATTMTVHEQQALIVEMSKLPKITTTKVKEIHANILANK